MMSPAPEARQITAHGETVGMVVNPPKPRWGATENQSTEIIFRPILGLDLISFITQGFTVGYFPPSLRDCIFRDSR